MKVCVVIILLVAVLLPGCVSVEKKPERFTATWLLMDTWTGRSIDEVADAWGASDSTMTRIDGGVTYTWVTCSSGRDGLQQCRQSFVTDSSGIVVSWSYVDCPKYIAE